jgi:8-oxo-dGTP pyrophosphatase MutT (NUDIX family)
MGPREVIDVYDAAGRHVGTKRRNLAHADGDWHHTFHCFVVSERPAGPALLLQRRHRRKPYRAGQLDSSAGGHLLAGETPADGVRELHEELGHHAAIADLEPVGMFPVAHGTGGCDHEFANLFVLRDSRQLSAWEFDRAEAGSLVEIGVDALEELLAGGTAVASEYAGGRVRTTRVKPGELVPLPTAYWSALLAAVRNPGTAHG